VWVNTPDSGHYENLKKPEMKISGGRALVLERIASQGRPAVG